MSKENLLSIIFLVYQDAMLSCNIYSSYVHVQMSRINRSFNHLERKILQLKRDKNVFKTLEYIRKYIKSSLNEGRKMINGKNLIAKFQ